MGLVMDYDVVIIGAGVVGLAIAENLAKMNLQCIIFEQHPSFGQETSSRNSEVIHSGIYYPTDSLKTKLCVEGNSLIYEFCTKFNIPHNKIGKYIIANNSEEIEKLETIYQSGLNNGVKGLMRISQTEFNKVEPNIIAKEVLYSPNSGIIDTHSLMKTFENHCLENNCDFAYNHIVIGLQHSHNGWEITVKDKSNQQYSLTAKVVINSAGLQSDIIVQLAGINIKFNNVELKYCKGHYFKIAPAKKYLAKHLIYPVSLGNKGLGIHLTVDLDGELKLGPDTLFLDENIQDYSINPELKSKFFEAAKRYIKNIQIDDISEDYSGIRPKLQSKTEQFRDFYIQEESARNLSGLINLIGIESPGLTSCIAIAKYVSRLI